MSALALVLGCGAIPDPGTSPSIHTPAVPAPADPAPAPAVPVPVGPVPTAADIGDAGGAGCTYTTEGGVQVLVDFGDDVFLGVDGGTVKLEPWNGFPRDHYPGPDGWDVRVTDIGENTSACPDDEACESWYAPVTLTITGPSGTMTTAARRSCGS